MTISTCCSPKVESFVLMVRPIAAASAIAASPAASGRNHAASSSATVGFGGDAAR